MPKRNITQGTAPAQIENLGRELGARIATARKRRRWRAVDLAARAGITRETLRRVEAGALGTGLGPYLAALWALGLAEDVRLLAAAERDASGRILADARLGERVRGEAVDDDF